MAVVAIADDRSKILYAGVWEAHTVAISLSPRNEGIFEEGARFGEL